MTAKRPPDTLSKDARLLWLSINRDYTLASASMLILKTALEQWDLYMRAQRELTNEPITLDTPHGKKTHPATTVMRAARDGFYAAMRMLAIDIEANEVGRPTDKRELKWGEKLKAVK